MFVFQYLSFAKKYYEKKRPRLSAGASLCIGIGF